MKIVKNPSTKKTKLKQMPMTKIQNRWNNARNPISDCNVLIIGICNLSFVIWDFSAISGQVNCFYLNQLYLTLTFP